MAPPTVQAAALLDSSIARPLATGYSQPNGDTASGAADGFVVFSNSSTAGNGTFTNNGGASSGAAGGTMIFSDNSSMR